MQVLEKKLHVLHEKHPDVAVVYHYLAELMKAKDEIDKAINYSRKAIAIMNSLNTAHQNIPEMLLLNAVLYEQSGNLKHASRIITRASEKCAEIRGAESPGCSRINQKKADLVHRYE